MNTQITALHMEIGIYFLSYSYFFFVCVKDVEMQVSEIEGKRI